MLYVTPKKYYKSISLASKIKELSIKFRDV